MRRVSKVRARQRRAYGEARKRYLAEHPYCQITIFLHSLDEADTIKNGGHSSKGIIIPKATQIHHRNKCNGPRLLDERWWISSCDDEHWHVENHKDWARQNGLLVPIQADPDGRWGAGNQALQTSDLLRVRAEGANEYYWKK